MKTMVVYRHGPQATPIFPPFMFPAVLDNQRTKQLIKRRGGEVSAVGHFDYIKEVSGHAFSAGIDTDDNEF